TPTTIHGQRAPVSDAQTASVPRHGISQTQWWLHETGEASSAPTPTTQIDVRVSPRSASRRASQRAAATTIAPNARVSARGGWGSRSSRALTPRNDWLVTYAMPPVRSGLSAWSVQNAQAAEGWTASPSRIVPSVVTIDVIAARRWPVTR